MSAAQIRQLTVKDDLSEATKLLIRFFREEQFDTPDEIIERNTATLAGLDTCGLFIAEADGRTIGVATVSLEFGVEFGWGAEMGDLYVLPDWRGKGVSRRLVQAIEDFLKDRGASFYQVTVTPYARDAHDLGKFYEGLGFGSEGRLILAKAL
ncbi:GNAT family N-acetyltransferase [Aestuariivirga sp. YIM B02566]|uniref:GNAT family N-acetyltransferase n=1 Tax=Taklimakanibacter albus TaxID=2800327 RepID=A0ACC5R288_9HYPH|nr:GNAT family N-acetyltransferase [Aestuariivirga sp. YIM B02566]MBK1866715.1 GNAT family N-acetyltransferase [Aestuariivirga sp. YIM B02566]